MTTATRRLYVDPNTDLEPRDSEEDLDLDSVPELRDELIRVVCRADEYGLQGNEASNRIQVLGRLSWLAGRLTWLEACEMDKAAWRAKRAQLVADPVEPMGAGHKCGNCGRRVDVVQDLDADRKPVWVHDDSGKERCDH